MFGIATYLSRRISKIGRLCKLMSFIVYLMYFLKMASIDNEATGTDKTSYSLGE